MESDLHKAGSGLGGGVEGEPLEEVGHDAEEEEEHAHEQEDEEHDSVGSHDGSGIGASTEDGEAGLEEESQCDEHKDISLVEVGLGQVCVCENTDGGDNGHQDTTDGEVGGGSETTDVKKTETQKDKSGQRENKGAIRSISLTCNLEVLFEWGPSVRHILFC